MKIPPVNDFPLEMFQLPGRLPETTLRIVGLVALIQDIAVTVPRVSIQFFAGAPHFPREQWKFMNRKSRLSNFSSASRPEIARSFDFARHIPASDKL